MKAKSYGAVKSGDAGTDQIVDLMVKYAKEDSKEKTVVNIAKKLYDNAPDKALENCFDYVIENIKYEYDPNYLNEAGTIDSIELIARPRYTLTGTRVGSNVDCGSLNPEMCKTLKQIKQGEDCDGMATALAALLVSSPFESFGWKVAFKVIDWKNDATGKPLNQFTHVYCVVFLPNHDIWTPLDPVMSKKGFGHEIDFAPIRRSKIYPVNY